MMLDCLGAGREPLGDLGVAQPFSQEREHLKLAIGQPLRIGARRWTGPTGKATRATLAEPPRAISTAGVAPSRSKMARATR